MLEFIESTDDVLAVRVSGKIVGGDLDSILDRLDRVMNKHLRIHVFVETRGIDGLELSSLGRYARRAMPLFSELNRFGRVAVVADQSWVRWGTRAESAILPFISYRTYLPEDREAALAWVENGETSD